MQEVENFKNGKVSVQGDQSYLRPLPLLDFTASLYPIIDFRYIYLICAQHLVSTTYSLFDSLLKLGMKASNISAIGKCYSTDPEAFREMQKLGIDVCESSLKFQSHTSFDQQYRSNIQEFIAARMTKLGDPNITKVIVLDDGGELISQIDAIEKNENKFIGIEQTSSGYHKIKDSGVSFSVINVARSPAKLNGESPIIANLVLGALLKNLTKLHIKPERVLVIGNGPIGSNIREILKNTQEVAVFDRIPSRSTVKHKNLKSLLGTFDLIIGCTGSASLSLEQFELLKKNAVLVSVSSSDREFNGASLRQKLPIIEDCHTNLNIQGKWLTNCGFPINFSSDFREIDCDELQLTRSLILLAILQAATSMNSSKHRFIPLDEKGQKMLVKQFHALFNKEQLLKV